jgi:hypothetical protein
MPESESHRRCSRPILGTPEGTFPTNDMSTCINTSVVTHTLYALMSWIALSLNSQKRSFLRE